MTGDLSQLRFDQKNRYSKVIHNQGRIFSDADFVEAAYIAAYFEETERVDVIGQNGSPVHDAGFLVVDSIGVKAKDVSWEGLCLSKGRCYVRGKVAEVILDSDASPLPSLSSCLTPGTTGANGEPNAGNYFVALEVYERYVAPVEEPDQMLDDALRGVDTTGRTRMEWRIRLETCNDGSDCADVPEDWPGKRTYPELTADAPAPDENTDPCISPNLGGYQGLENQLYRVEVYSAGVNPTLTWSSDNGSLLAQVEKAAATVDAKGIIQVSSLGRDPKMGFQQAKIIEVLTREDLQHGRRGILLTDFTPEGETEILVNSGWDSTLETAANGGFIRRWDGQSEIKSNTPLFLEPERKDIFVTVNDVALLLLGDYWCIPTRALSGKVLWPTDDTGKKIGRPPFGTYVSTAVVGILKGVGNKWTLESDCRNIFYPLTEQTRLLYVGGDGQEAMPGNKIPQRLEVGVANGVTPVKGAKVEWTLTGDVTLSVASGTVVPTDDSGISWVEATMGGVDPMKEEDFTARVTARLKDEHEQYVDVPVRFTVRKSIARNVANTPLAGCAGLAGTKTVQAAIDRLASIKRFTMEGGDGQVVRALTKEHLPEPLVVRVWSLCGPAVEETVVFVPLGGEVWDERNNRWTTEKLPVVTNRAGNASCFWRPGKLEKEKPFPPETDKPRPPEVIALFESQDKRIHGTWEIRFSCQFLDAADIAYDAPETCTVLKTAESVQDALDSLCANLGSIPQRFYHLDEVLAGKSREKVIVGGTVNVSLFLERLTFVFNEQVSLTDVFNRGTVSVEAELVARNINDSLGAGTRLRVVLIERNPAEIKPSEATWFSPDIKLQQYNQYIEAAQTAGDQGLMIRVTLRGDYMPVMMEGGIGYLRNATSTIDSTKRKVIDDQGGPGGNVEFWFWLVSSRTNNRTFTIAPQLRRNDLRLKIDLDFAQPPGDGARQVKFVVTRDDTGESSTLTADVNVQGTAATATVDFPVGPPGATRLPTTGYSVTATIDGVRYEGKF